MNDENEIKNSFEVQITALDKLFNKICSKRKELLCDAIYSNLPRELFFFRLLNDEYSSRIKILKNISLLDTDEKRATYDGQIDRLRFMYFVHDRSATRSNDTYSNRMFTYIDRITDPAIRYFPYNEVEIIDAKFLKQTNYINYPTQKQNESRRAMELQTPTIINTPSLSPSDISSDKTILFTFLNSLIQPSIKLAIVTKFNKHSVSDSKNAPIKSIPKRPSLMIRVLNYRWVEEKQYLKAARKLGLVLQKLMLRPNLDHHHSLKGLSNLMRQYMRVRMNKN